MKNLSHTLVITVFIIIIGFLGCTAQNQQSGVSTANPLQKDKLVGGGCDGCELMYAGMPKEISSTDTSTGWTERGQKLIVTGTVFHFGGKEPAAGVILYYWHTDNNGLYSANENTAVAARRHGHIRGWVKTDAQGRYSIYTIRPAPYPNKSMPAHIHWSVKEPGIEEEYYIDEFVFDDDPLLTTEKRKALENRGGSGVLRIIFKDSIQIAEHNIILGLHIPNYPVLDSNTIKSGLNIGEDQPSFSPFHAYGPDKGSTVCPVCKYGRYQGILYFVGDHPNWTDIKKWLSFLENETLKKGKFLKIYFVYGNQINYNKSRRVEELEELGKELNIKNTALTFVPSFADTTSDIYLNHLDPHVANTFIIYRNITIVEKFTSLKPEVKNFKLISSALENTKSAF